MFLFWRISCVSLLDLWKYQSKLVSAVFYSVTTVWIRLFPFIGDPFQFRPGYMEVLPGPKGYTITPPGPRFIVDVYWRVHWCHSGPSTDVQATRPISKLVPFLPTRGTTFQRAFVWRSQLPSKDQGHGWGLAITARVWNYSLQRPLEHLRRFLRHAITIWRLCCQEVLNCPPPEFVPAVNPRTSPGLTSFSHPSPVSFLDHWLQEDHVQQGVHTPKPGHFQPRCKLSFGRAVSQTECCALSNSVWLHFA